MAGGDTVEVEVEELKEANDTPMTDEAPSAATTPAAPDAGANNQKGRKKKARKRRERATKETKALCKELGIKITCDKGSGSGQYRFEADLQRKIKAQMAKKAPDGKHSIAVPH